MRRENLDGVYNMRLMVHAVNFDDSHVMAINGEDVVGVAREADQAEPIAGKTEGQYDVSTS